MTFEEFAAIYDAYATQRDLDFKDKWTRMRLLATITIQPHLGKGKKLTPEKLLPFPWEKKNSRKIGGDGPELTPDQQRRRMEKIVEKLGDELV